MKVLLINGSPRAKGNTNAILSTFKDHLADYNIVAEPLHIGAENIRGCLDCGACAKNNKHHCIIKDDPVNESIDLIAAAQGLVIASPVYFTGLNGTLKSFLDRVFNIFWHQGDALRFKIGVALAVGRRVGGLETIGQIQRYFEHSSMIIPGASYWPVTYGLLPDECFKDIEGLHLVKELAGNTAWLINAVEAGKKNMPLPQYEQRPMTNFIR